MKTSCFPWRPHAKAFIPPSVIAQYFRVVKDGQHKIIRDPEKCNTLDFSDRGVILFYQTMIADKNFKVLTEEPTSLIKSSQIFFHSVFGTYLCGRLELWGSLYFN